ncbi:MFS transporter [Nocardia panacis]|uniref:MFS transporter n=1 Tax=Nocardia panacis TaxID=2340916 RepID=A0A3A4KBB3_9NOCA|nr:MFS transporter [Nocardia panacis]RJO69908.1 MFS transporter [Nocardia panacis]
MRNFPMALWALVIAAFALGADEFVVAGVVEEIAAALHISLGAVGRFESAYALGVAIGAPLFTAIGSRVSRRFMLLSTTGVFLAGNIISLFGPNYGWILTGRIVAALAHGAFFGIAAVFAAQLVSERLRGRAIATVFAGSTAATILGAPIGAAVGRALGWRATFGTLVLFGGLAIVGLLLLLPRDLGHKATSRADHEATASLRDQLRALRRPGVLIGLLTTFLGYGGVFTGYVYLAPQLREATGLGSGWVTPMFLLFGIGLFLGNHLGGKFADRNLPQALMGSIGGLAVALFALTALIHHPITAAIGILAYGVGAFSVVAPLQLRVMQQAADAPDIASAANISAFTLGSALGIWLGGAAIDSGLGVTSVDWVGGLIAAGGFGLALVSRRLDRTGTAVHLAHHH